MLLVSVKDPLNFEWSYQCSKGQDNLISYNSYPTDCINCHSNPSVANLHCVQWRAYLLMHPVRCHRALYNCTASLILQYNPLVVEANIPFAYLYVDFWWSLDGDFHTPLDTFNLSTFTQLWPKFSFGVEESGWFSKSPLNLLFSGCVH